jgi:hypothetical protein
MILASVNPPSELYLITSKRLSSVTIKTDDAHPSGREVDRLLISWPIRRALFRTEEDVAAASVFL